MKPTSPLTVSNLSCEYQTNPLGLDEPAPRLGWTISSDRRATAQGTCRVRVATTPEILTTGGADVWDSGVVATPSACLTYAGRPLNSRERCWWTVDLRDNYDRSAAAPTPAWFEMGLLDPSDWRAGWMGWPAAVSGAGLLFQGGFDISKPVRQARVYVAGLGYYELRLNGRKVDDTVLEPAPTDCTRRIPYATLDVTHLIRPGANRIGAWVGNGWYGMPLLLVQVEILHPDGTTTRVHSGAPEFARWRVARSPITRNAIYDGETYDARLERPDWDLPSGSLESTPDRLDGWSWAMSASPPGGRLVARQPEPIRVVDTLRPTHVAEVRPGIFVFDLGRNIAGWARLRVRGPRGTTLLLRFAESLYPDGTVNPENLRAARSEDVYILKGGDVEEWEPRFTYHGFRYVQVEGWPGTPLPDDLDGRVVRSDVAERGAFDCDQGLILAIHTAVRRTEAGNLHGIPTDCPQRDERLGWLNDVTARAEEAIHNFDLTRFFGKWLDDIADAQDPATGALPDTIPFRFGFRPCDPVCIGLLLLPWLLQRHTGDDRLARRLLPNLCKWVDCLAAHTDAEGVLTYSFWGDWAPPTLLGAQVQMGNDPRNASAPGELVSTAFLYYHAALLARIAGQLHEPATQAPYAALAARTADLFHRRFWNEAVGGYGTGSQSCNALALYLGLVPAGLIPRVVDNLVREVDRYEGHLTTGNICTKYLLEALTDAGRMEVAWRIATQEDYPGWGYMLAHDATTIWERWELATGGAMNSHNHPMLGSIGAWFYRAVAGLRVETWGPEGLRFSVRPPPVLPGLTRASARLTTPCGPMGAAWKRTGGCLTVEVTVPVGGEASLHLPPGPVRLDDRPLKSATEGVRIVRVDERSTVVTFGSGDYQFTQEETA